MSDALNWLVLAGVFTLLQWTPYIAQRALLWGPATFLNNYPPGYPDTEPTPPAWANRAKRAHLNMVETLPAFAAVVLATEVAGISDAVTGQLAAAFVLSRVVYTLVYLTGVPYLRTPTYLVSWALTLALAGRALLA